LLARDVVVVGEAFLVDVNSMEDPFPAMLIVYPVVSNEKFALAYHRGDQQKY
jgi:hypothetical protein